MLIKSTYHGRVSLDFTSSNNPLNSAASPLVLAQLSVLPAFIHSLYFSALSVVFVLGNCFIVLIYMHQILFTRAFNRFIFSFPAPLFFPFLFLLNFWDMFQDGLENVGSPLV